MLPGDAKPRSNFRCPRLPVSGTVTRGFQPSTPSNHIDKRASKHKYCQETLLTHGNHGETKQKIWTEIFVSAGKPGKNTQIIPPRRRRRHDKELPRWNTQSASVLI